MKKILCSLATLVALSTAGSAFADNFYAGVFGGANWLQHTRSHEKTRTGYLVGFDLGYRWCGGFRTEFEFAYRNNQRRHRFDDSLTSHRHHTNNYAALINARYYWEDIDCWNVKPFIGAGIGVASEKRRGNDCNHSSKRRCSFAWQILAGIAYPVNDCVELELAYRFFNITRIKKSYNHGLTLGVNYNF